MFGALKKSSAKKPAASQDAEKHPVDDAPFSYRRAIRNNWKTGFLVGALVSLPIISRCAADV